MQNKANFRKAQMNVNSLITKDYRKNDDFAAQKTKPIQSQSKPISKAKKYSLWPDYLFSRFSLWLWVAALF